VLPFISSSPIHGIVLAGFIFAFTYMCAHFLHHTHSPKLFPQHLCLLTGANPPCWAGPVSCSCSLILKMRKTKK
jgi:hypothetical protein